MKIRRSASRQDRRGFSGLAEGLEIAGNVFCVGDQSQKLHGAAAVDAGLDIEGEGFFQEFRPRTPATPMGRFVGMAPRGLWIVPRLRGFGFGNHERAPCGSGGKDPAVPSAVKSGRRYSGCQA